MTKQPKKLAPIPHVAWRDGRPRFSPGPEVRALGFAGEDLRHDDDRWFSRGEALDWAEKRAAEIVERREDAKRKAKRKRHVFEPPAAPARPEPATIYTVARLFEDWFLSPQFPQPVPRGAHVPPRKEGEKAYATMRDYRKCARALERHDHELYHSAVAALDQPILVGLHEDMWQKKGLHTANACMRVLSAAISWGIKRGKVRLAVNPARSMGNATPPPRVRFATRSEIETLIAAADTIGRPEIGDMVMLGVWTGQRQSDRLSMDHKDGPRGRHVFHQRKTGAIVMIPEAPQLAARLAEAKARRASAGIASRRVVLDERSWRPFLGDHYRHVWSKVRAAAVAGVEDEAATARLGRKVWTVQPCPTLEGFRDQDLRDTAVTWMGLAGLTIPEICAITGHSLETAHTIMKHYLARHPDMANAGMAKLVAWFESNEQTEGEWQ